MSRDFTMVPGGPRPTESSALRRDGLKPLGLKSCWRKLEPFVTVATIFSGTPVQGTTSIKVYLWKLSCNFDSVFCY